jgi:hypothetical protein
MANRFKVTVEFEVDINPISVPDAESLLAMRPAMNESKAAKWSEADLRKAMKQKGMSEEEINKALAAKESKGAKDTKNKEGQKEGQTGGDPQMLLYPEYEAWADAQRKLQEAMLADESLAYDYAREMVRDLMRGRVELVIDAKYGAPRVHEVLAAAMRKLPAADQARLKADEMALLGDETELVDNAVACRFAGISVTTR